MKSGCGADAASEFREAQDQGHTPLVIGELTEAEHINEVFERVPEAIVLVDAEGQIQRINCAFTDLSGYTQEEALGQSLKELITLNDPLAEIDANPSSPIAQDESAVPETLLRHKDGTGIPVSFAKVPVLSPGTGNPWYAIYRDLTEVKSAKERPSLEQEPRAHSGAIVGDSPALTALLDLVSVVAPTDSSVLILGETGTGKELIARALHDLSPRRERAFVKVNCAALPMGLLESELFGHERGAFTGAIAQKAGRFELADKGTLLLDEVGDIPLELQAKLLRVLQEQEFERLGSTRTHKVDVRLIAATHRDLLGMVRESAFREDLYYRLNVFPICVPPLRERSEDIPKLVRHFTELSAQRMNKRIDEISPETMDRLVRYPWPGNVRELRNFIERAVILSPLSILRAPISELDLFRAQQDASVPMADPQPMTGLQEVERDHILRALDASNWVVGGYKGAAARLGMKRTTLLYRIQKLGIRRPSH